METITLMLVAAVLAVAFWGLRIFLVLLQIAHEGIKIYKTFKNN